MPNENAGFTLQGSAQFMPPEETARHRLLDDGRPGLLFGRSKAGLLKYCGDGNTLVVAPPGAGKGVGFVIPNLLTYPGSMVVIDPKGENAALTAQHRREVMKQNVFILDPAGVLDVASDAYNPFAWLHESEPDRFDADVRNMAEALVPGDGMESFWARGGRMAAAGLIYYLASQKDADFSLTGLYDLAFLGDTAWLNLWREMRVISSGSPDLARRVVEMGNWFEGLEEKHQLYHRGTLQDGLQWLISNGARRVVASSSFELRRIKDEPMTVYLCIPPLELSTYKPLARLVVTHALQAVMARLARPGETPVVFMLDEFANSVGQMEVFDQAYSQVRGYGGRIAVVLQTIGQLRDLYPEGKGRSVSWQTIEETSGAAVYFKARGETAKHVSERLGLTTKLEGGPGGARQVQRPLKFPNEVSSPDGAYGQESVFALIEGLDPLWVRTLKSYQDTEFKSKYNPNDFKPRTRGNNKSWRQEALENPPVQSAGAASRRVTVDPSAVKDLLTDIGWT